MIRRSSVFVGLPKRQLNRRLPLLPLLCASKMTTPPPAAADGRPKYRLIDVGANLLDEMYGGVYNGSVKHEGDLAAVLRRARSSAGVEGVFVTAGTLGEARRAAELCNNSSAAAAGLLRPGEGSCWLRSTVGVHPTRCLEFESSSPALLISSLLEVCVSNSSVVVALGEFGLDADRVNFCPYETQLKYFELQLRELGPATGLPLFLHCRGPAAASDLTRILANNPTCFPAGGVVHSFDGTKDELDTFLQLGLYIGVNGCSLKTEATCAVVGEIPLDRLVLETDAPWCAIRPSHFSNQFVKTPFPAAKKTYDPQLMFKTRNEPQTLLNVLEVVAGLKNIDEAVVAEAVFNNTNNLFRLNLQ